jgi:hypothetical protein
MRPLTACCARYHGRGRGDSQYGMTGRRHPLATAVLARSGCRRRWRPHRGHNGRLRTIGQLCCSIARKGAPLSDLVGREQETSQPRGVRRYSARRPRLLTFPSTFFSAPRHSWEASPRSRTSALSPLGDWARGKETLPAHQPSAGHSTQTKQPNQQPANLSRIKTTKVSSDIIPRRSRNCRAVEAQMIEKAPQLGGALCLRSMPTVGIIVGISVGTAVGIGCG